MTDPRAPATEEQISDPLEHVDPRPWIGPPDYDDWYFDNDKD